MFRCTCQVRSEVLIKISTPRVVFKPLVYQKTCLYVPRNTF
nr:MAG TPA: hypothetical protein [Caudoviricetes sp.]